MARSCRSSSKAGQQVAKGDRVAVIEAMKMEHTLLRRRRRRDLGLGHGRRAGRRGRARRGHRGGAGQGGVRAFRRRFLPPLPAGEVGAQRRERGPITLTLSPSPDARQGSHRPLSRRERWTAAPRPGLALLAATPAPPASASISPGPRSSSAPTSSSRARWPWSRSPAASCRRPSTSPPRKGPGRHLADPADAREHLRLRHSPAGHPARRHRRPRDGPFWRTDLCMARPASRAGLSPTAKGGPLGRRAPR